MATLAEVKKQVRDLSQKGIDILNDPSLTNTKKVAQTNRIDAAMRPLLQELDDLESVEERRKSLGFDPYAAGSASGTFAPMSASRGALGIAPLDLGLDEAQRLFKSARAGESVTIKAAPMTTGTTDPATAPHSILPPIGIRREPTRILDRIPVTATDSAINRYYVTTASGAGAGITAEGAQKPESDLAFAKQDAIASKIAVWAEATEESLEDFPGFTSFLSADLRDQIIDAENAALLNATGTAPATFKGLLQVTGTLTTTGTLAAALDGISQAIDGLRVGSRYLDADSIIMNPVDLGKIRRLKASGTGDYLMGPPNQSGPSDIWGIPVIKTTKIAAGTIIVANLEQACQVFLRSGLTVRTNANGAGFRNNLIEIVAEERLSLAVTAPTAINVVTLT